MFNKEQIRKYAESIFEGHRFTDRPIQRLKCPIHNGRDKNFAIDMRRGVWTCHSHCGSGGMVQLEQRLFGGSREEATSRLFSKLGMSYSIGGKQIVCTYDYVDSSGKLLYQKLRLDPKDFTQRTPTGDYGYAYGADTKQGPLYGLPGVLTCNVCFVVEGEKDADTLNAFSWEENSQGRFYATTSGSADSWRKDHAFFLAGKRVFVFEDNDEKGQKFVEQVCRTSAPYAHQIRIIRFRDQPEHSDVSDFLKAHGREALVERLKQSEIYVEPEVDTGGAVVEGMQYAYSAPSEETEWLIDGVIHSGGNGIIMGDPKASKSLSSLDMILSLISGTPWHGCTVPRRVKVGLVTREDHPNSTKRRILRMMSGRSLVASQIEGWLWVNSREQTATFDILNDTDFARLTTEFKAQGCEVIFFDVFNRIHKMEENDNTQMAQITAKLTEFGQVVGAQIALVHHINKDYGNGNVFNRLRGAGALHGWMEWGMAITTTNPEDDRREWIRRIEFESKEEVVDPIFFKIEADARMMRMVTADAPTNNRRSRLVMPIDSKARAAGRD